MYAANGDTIRLPAHADADAGCGAWRSSTRSRRSRARSSVSCTARPWRRSPWPTTARSPTRSPHRGPPRDDAGPRQGLRAVHRTPSLREA
jgi:hypothetical protein